MSPSPKKGPDWYSIIIKEFMEMENFWIGVGILLLVAALVYGCKWIMAVFEAFALLVKGLGL